METLTQALPPGQPKREWRALVQVRTIQMHPIWNTPRVPLSLASPRNSSHWSRLSLPPREGLKGKEMESQSLSLTCVSLGPQFPKLSSTGAVEGPGQGRIPQPPF